MGTVRSIFTDVASAKQRSAARRRTHRAKRAHIGKAVDNDNHGALGDTFRGDLRGRMHMRAVYTPFDARHVYDIMRDQCSSPPHPTSSIVPE